MTKWDMITTLIYISFCSFLTVVSSLTLPNMVTQRSRHTKYSSSTLPPVGGSLVSPDTVIVTPGQGIALYTVKDNDGATCILLKTDAVIEVEFKSHIGDEESDTYIPEHPTIEGNCQYEDRATMTLTWGEYVLFWEFSKTLGGERWYVNNIELTLSTNIPAYHNIKAHGSHFKLVHDQMLFPTPVGKSYSCDESVVDLTSKDPQGKAQGLKGKLLLRAFQLQPFMFKGSSFGQSFECNAQLGFKDETAPIAVGSTLAIAVLMTVTGYGIYRYFKIKKVQYNTME